MNILFQSRTTLFSVPGGDTTQVIKTAEELRKTGCSVDITTELEPDLGRYDLVHLFNLIRPQELYLQAQNAKKQGRPVALSTIYVDYSEYDLKGRTGCARLVSNLLSQSQLEYLKILARVVKNREYNKGTRILLLNGYNTLLKKVIDLIDVFLPNSASEMRRLISNFPECAGRRHVVVPNSVDIDLFDETKVLNESEFEHYQGCVLCVGRVEGIKSQLNLVRAMRGLPWRLVLVGKPAPNHVGYYEQIKKEAGPNVHFIGQLDHDKLPGIYKVAKVHCLVSWMETTGLSSLEAGVMGCNLVITSKGDTRDYFGDYAYYCEPDSVQSIRNAIIKAYESPADTSLREHIRNNFTWRMTAKKPWKDTRWQYASKICLPG